MEVVFAAAPYPWGPIDSICASPDGQQLFFSTPERVYTLGEGKALSIVNNSGGSIRLRAGRLYVNDRRRRLLYRLTPKSSQPLLAADDRGD